MLMSIFWLNLCFTIFKYYVVFFSSAIAFRHKVLLKGYCFTSETRLALKTSPSEVKQW